MMPSLAGAMCKHYSTIVVHMQEPTLSGINLRSAVHGWSMYEFFQFVFIQVCAAGNLLSRSCESFHHARPARSRLSSHQVMLIPEFVLCELCSYLVKVRF